jgi:rhomboid protease GluP
MGAVPMCPGCRALLAPDEAACPYCGWNVRLTEVRRAGGFVDRALRPLGGLVPALIGANLLLYALTALTQMALTEKGPDSLIDSLLNPHPAVLMILGANLPDEVLEGRVWRLFSPVFLHGGLLHIGSNMLALRWIGSLVEQGYGAGKALALYLLAGVAGNVAGVAWATWSGEDGMVPRIGASGAIMGFAGILAALGLRFGGVEGKRIWKEMFEAVGLTLVLGYFLGFDNAAHVGGFLCGLLSGWLCTVGIRARGNLAAVRGWDVLAVVLTLLTIASFVPSALLLREVVRPG